MTIMHHSIAVEGTSTTERNDCPNQSDSHRGHERWVHLIPVVLMLSMMTLWTFHKEVDPNSMVDSANMLSLQSLVQSNGKPSDRRLLGQPSLQDSESTLAEASPQVPAAPQSTIEAAEKSAPHPHQVEPRPVFSSDSLWPASSFADTLVGGVLKVVGAA
eukprot:TRINITY_DN64491_c0_g1_i1.p1 TRINITY_DN64491_c0_g1~~TRINITY_DN64491_c0_g1_i1.p1  ORF type:complete len:181 (+),score=1.73 TRINITY_DN64491_c0_g1_i1:68-544(+)